MGAQLCKAAKIYINQPVADGADFEKPSPEKINAQVRLVISANDYKQTDNPLSCSIDGKNFEELARNCGVQDISALYDEQCTVQQVTAKIQEVGSRCGPDDVFIFYYSGHGANLDDDDGDEDDGQDECFCFVTPDGQINYNSCMRDDAFADIVCGAIDEETRIVVISDCCHSGTICDLDKECWQGREVVAMSGCQDDQTSGDIGRGGIFTHSLLKAIADLQQQGDDDYSVGLAYNSTLEFDDQLFDSAQDIAIQCAPGITPDTIAWPLIPRSPYTAPLDSARGIQGRGIDFHVGGRGGRRR